MQCSSKLSCHFLSYIKIVLFQNLSSLLPAMLRVPTPFPKSNLTLYCTVLPYVNIPFINFTKRQKYKNNVLLFSCEGSLLLQYEK